ncbi:unnamed protein product [Cuscuta europaea]|uniref:Survival motor neuron Tudor domain-containing protein n=1 Tax=Cuscuta europaea TaxID=41803 RepID=A0A9P1DYG2_CUSEU|nr:unnamed protein product [Cuscuta europaea]
MGNGEDDLRDECDLTNAFDDAISKYKIKHNLAGGGATSAQVNSSVVGDENRESRRQKETGDENEVLSTQRIEIGEASNASPAKENFCTETSGIEQSLDKTTSDVDPESVEDYNGLVEKYYELEGQMQQIIQKLNQFGDLSHQNPVSSTLTPQEHQSYGEQPSYYFCYPHECQGQVYPFMVPPAYYVGENGTDKNSGASRNTGCDQNTTSFQEPDVITTMDAAAKALSSVGVDSGNEGEPMMSNDHEVNESEPQTALPEVLHAWYAAGYYTGKYLKEQSRAAKRHE